MLNKAREMRPNDAAVYMQLAGFYNRQGDFTKTMEALHQHPAGAQQSRGPLHRGDLLLGKGLSRLHHAGSRQDEVRPAGPRGDRPGHQAESEVFRGPPTRTCCFASRPTWKRIRPDSSCCAKPTNGATRPRKFAQGPGRRRRITAQPPARGDFPGPPSERRRPFLCGTIDGSWLQAMSASACHGLVTCVRQDREDSNNRS